MNALLEAYPYLCMGLAMLALLLAILPLCPPRLRRQALVSAAVATPSAFWELLAVPDYWDPARLFVVLKTGPEDLVFCFAAGGLSWLIAMWPLGGRLVLAPKPGLFLGRGLLCVLIFLVAQLLMRRWGLSPGATIVLSVAIIDAALLCLQKPIWPTVALGAIGHGLFYFALLRLAFAAAPDFLLQWNHRGLCGPILAGVPADEIVWGVLFGAGWPLAVTYALQAQLQPAAEGAPSPSGGLASTAS